MSLFGAMNSAISGLTAQSDAFGDISDNVANSQTIGFKRVDTAFVDYLTTSTAARNDPGAVVAKPMYVNDVQGTIKGTDSPLNVAIAGQGFFAVSQEIGLLAGRPTFNPQQYYSRAGDFSLNNQGYMVNSAGLFLNGWVTDPVTKVVNQNALVPIQVSQTALNPQQTLNVDLSANLPATPTAGTATALSPISSNITVYDALGTAHTVTLDWALNVDAAGLAIPNDWTLTVTLPDPTGAVPPAVVGNVEVQFGGLAPAPVNPLILAGTIGQILPGPAPGTIVPTAYAGLGSAATMVIGLDFDSGPQSVNLNLGSYGSGTGVTQYAGTAYNLEGLSQDGVPPGNYSGVAIQANGIISVNYNNGQTRTIGQVPLVTFNAPNSLQRQDGQAFTSTTASGDPLAEQINTNGAGNLVINSVESSNVDIASEFSKLIIAQQAYSANTKVVTTANDMLQATIAMKQ